jgi:hypothetical protein
MVSRACGESSTLAGPQYELDLVLAGSVVAGIELAGQRDVLRAGARMAVPIMPSLGDAGHRAFQPAAGRGAQLRAQHAPAEAFAVGRVGVDRAPPIHAGLVAQRHVGRGGARPVADQASTPATAAKPDALIMTIPRYSRGSTRSETALTFQA